MRFVRLARREWLVDFENGSILPLGDVRNIPFRNLQHISLLQNFRKAA